MCFPNKKQKNNFTDTDQGTELTKGDNQKTIKVEPSTTSTSPISASTLPTITIQPAPTLPTLTTQTQLNMAPPKIAIIIYSMYGHVARLAEAEKEGVQNAGGIAEIYQVPETLPQEILTKMHAPGKPNYPHITPDILAGYDAFILGVPTRYGNMPAQWKAFWDSTGQLWAEGKLAGKYASFFVSTAGPGGGQESTVLASLSTLTHHGVLYVPFGYSHAFPQLTNLEQVHGGSPWGAGTFAAADGSRQPSEIELDMARIQGTSFFKTVSKVNF